MDVSLNTNFPNLVAQYTVQETNKALVVTMERLATGFKVNNTSDDAAGLLIATRLEAQSRGAGVAMRNSQDAVSMMQMAEGAMDEMTNVAFHMYELAIQAASGSFNNEDLDALNAEFMALADQLVGMQSATRFGGQSLLGENGLFANESGVQYQIGANVGDSLNVDVSDIIKVIDIATQHITKNDLLTQSAARASMSLLHGDLNEDGAGIIGLLGQARSAFGAQINVLGHHISNISNVLEHIDDVKGRILDTDYSRS